MLPRRASVATLAAGALAASATAQRLDFEDLHGPCGARDLVAGPGTLAIPPVVLATPDAATWNAGAENSFPAGLGNPFDSDSLHVFAYGPGARIAFPAPIARIAFVAGERTSMQTYPTFRLEAGGAVLATFGASLHAPELVEAAIDPPASEVSIVFVAGSSSQLGIDELAWSWAGWETYCDAREHAAACPCGPSAAGAGCASSSGSGAALAGDGAPSLAADTVVLRASGVAGASAVFLQGSQRAAAPFGDGVLCVGGTIVRLGVVRANAGEARFPGAGDPPLSLRGAVSAPGTRYYQVLYRDPAIWCTDATTNLTNALAVEWS